MRKRRCTLGLHRGKRGAVAGEPARVARVERGIGGTVEERFAQRGIRFIAETREAAQHQFIGIVDGNAEILRLGAHANGEANTQALTFAELRREGNLVYQRIYGKVDIVALVVGEAHHHIGAFDMGHIGQHLHHDLVAVVDGIGEVDVHAVRTVFALNIEHLLKQLVVHQRVETRAPTHHVKFNGKAALVQRRTFPGILQERQVDLAHLEMREDHHVIGLG